MTWRHALACALTLLVPSSALADAIGPPTPIECPEGSTAATNHCGTVCFAQAPCEADSECGAGERCVERPLCVEHDVPCGGWGGTYSIVRGACSGGSCGQGSCEPVRSCSASNTPSDGGPVGTHTTYGCGCRAAGDGSQSAAGLVVLAMMLCALRIRRRSSATYRR